MNTQKQIALIVVLLFVMMGGCAAYTVIDLPIRAVDQAEYQEAGSVERGALLFANNCRTCHGIKGEGSVGGGVGPPLNGAIRESVGLENFQDQDPLVLQNNRALLTRTLECGRAATLMPAWLNTNGGALNERQIEHLVNLITAPADETDPETELPTSTGWLEAVEFGHNLNHETPIVVGGDTLDTIATAHVVGPNELKELNGLTQGLDEFLPRSITLELLDGTEYFVRNSNETIRKIANVSHQGASLIAQENGIPYEVTERLGNYTLTLGESEFSRPVGLIPGVFLSLPEGASYVIRGGDTLQSIADQRGITPDQIVDLNPAEGVLSTTVPDEELEPNASLALPDGAVVIAREGDTPKSIAEEHGIEPAELVELNGLANEEVVLDEGQTMQLPADVRYLIQAGDTLQIAADFHGVSVDDLVGANEIEDPDPDAPLAREITLALPKIDEYEVSGQSLEDIAGTLSGVTADDIGAAQDPPVEANAVYAIGSTLTTPENAWGSAPPDAINNGTACVEHAVSDSGFAELFGGGGPPEQPEEVSEEVEIASNVNDWTVTADGTGQPANEGAVTIAPGTDVTFRNNVGLHTITINDEKQGEDFGEPDEERVITFEDSGTFEITCDFHPDMLAYVFVTEGN